MKDIIKLQKEWQVKFFLNQTPSKTPLFLRGKGAKPLFYGLVALTGFNFIYSMMGIWDMMILKNKKSVF